jgi:hypothetical protein
MCLATLPFGTSVSHYRFCCNVWIVKYKGVIWIWICICICIFDVMQIDKFVVVVKISCKVRMVLLFFSDIYTVVFILFTS